jgi:hypothetical protein
MMVVNVGSCGLPRDQGDLLAFAMYDSNTGCCEVFRVRIDIGQIIDHFALLPAADEVYQCLARVKSEPVFGRQLA